MIVDSSPCRRRPAPPPTPLTTPATPTGGSVVKVTGTQGNWGLTVNGAPYQVKGLTYGPPADSAAGLHADLKSMGVNTIRTWGTDGTIAAAARHGRRVRHQGDQRVLAQPGRRLRQRHRLQDEHAELDRRTGSTRYKNNPGVLMWDVGNEVILTTQDHYTGRADRSGAHRVRAVRRAGRRRRSTRPTRTTRSPRPTRGPAPGRTTSSTRRSLDLMAVNSYGAVVQRQGRLASRRLHQAVHPHRGRRRPASGRCRTTRTACRPSRPTPQKRDAYPASWNCLTGDTGVSLGATFFHYGTRERLRRRVAEHVQRRLEAAVVLLGRAACTAATPARTRRR